MGTTRLTTPLRAVVIGSGNVASAIAPALELSGAINVEQVYSPNPLHSGALALKLHNATAVSDPRDVEPNADLYLVAVSDDAISKAAGQITASRNSIWLHTSGGVESSVMQTATDNYGVLYPLQTFSQGVEVDITQVPIFIQGNNELTLNTARRLAESLSPKVYEADGQRRKCLHAAAVFACNFTNHLWAVADDVLHRTVGVDIQVLKPLLEETLRKALTIPPAQAQTGPARRGDRGVIERHCQLLNNDEAEIYRMLSEHIINRYHGSAQQSPEVG